MNCPCAAVGWGRPEQEAFIREVCTGSAPPVPALQRTTRSDLAPCGVWLQCFPTNCFCSLCFDAVADGVRLADGEILCTVCISHTFDSAEQYDSAPQPPPVALLARTDKDGRMCREDLGGLRGRALTLMLDVRIGDELRFCSCLPSIHVRGKTGVFVGYCTRRQLAIIRIDDALACMCMASAEDPLMLRSPLDESAALHESMLTHLMPVASQHTLQGALGAVRAAHTQCGSSTLEAAEALLARLADQEQQHDDELLLAQQRRAAPSRRLSPAGLPLCLPRVEEEEPRALQPAHRHGEPTAECEEGAQQGLAAQLSRANTCPLELSSKPHNEAAPRAEGSSQQQQQAEAPASQQRVRCGPMCGWIACGCAK